MSMDKSYIPEYPDELRQLAPEALTEIAKALRATIIETLSKGEGHLGSSLGTVELTLALHYVFSTPNDILIWDVGHQAYSHKLLTGRKNTFDSLRQFNGISGFPNRAESVFDAFGTGHAGTSISAALGMALSRQAQNSNQHHIAVVGDASIVTGMAFEALNHLGTTTANVLVILNDNTMGIDPSVGALKSYFESVKNDIPSTPNFFKSLNLDYSGPIDGHNIPKLLKALFNQKEKKGPRVLHIVTKKGKGLPPAENQQVTYHAPGKFDPLTGKLNPPEQIEKIKYQEVFGKTLLELIKKNPKIMAITPAMPTGSGLVECIEQYPDRCFDVGIAEQHAVSLAAGMATTDRLPFCIIYSTFLQRAYDQIIHDVALQNLPVVFCIDRAGLVGHDGPTHHGVFDIAFLRGIPNLQIIAPRNARELQNTLYTIQKGISSPVALRFPRGYSELESVNHSYELLSWGKGWQLKEGTKLAVISVGNTAENVALALENGVDTEEIAHYDLRFIKPLDTILLHSIFKFYKGIICVEEGIIKGGAGSAILEFAAENGYTIPIELIGIPDQFIHHGNYNILTSELGLDPKGLSKKIDQFRNKILG